MSQQLQITGGAKVRSLEGVITGSTGVLGSLPINGSNGIPQLDVNGKILVSQLPNSVMEYLGTWDASTNTPTLVNGTGNAGDVYLCNVAGTVNFGAGPITFYVGDQVIYSGTIWQRASGATGSVTSVAVTETGDALTITGSPITTSGTINIGFAGTSAQYVAGDGTLVTFPTISNEAQRLITEVYNETGATLTKGTVVYINGGHGNLPTVAKALATGDATSAQTYGVVQSDIGNNNNGFVVVIGSLMDLDTQAYTEGTQLYLSSTTAGAWTSTKQYAPAHLVYVAIVTRSHPSQGVVEVKIMNGFELDELHNVSAQTPSNNDGIFYNTGNGLWESKSIATALGYTPISGTGTTNYIPKFTSSTALGNSLLFDNGTQIGINTITPSYTLDVYGTIGTTSTIYANGGGGGIVMIGTGTGATSYIVQNFNSNILFLGDQATATKGINIDVSNGNIGIGTSIPSHKLDVVGTGRFSGQLTLSSTITNGTYTYTLPSATGTLALTSDLSSYVPTSRTLTINGTTYDLSADRSWTISGGVSGSGTTNYVTKWTSSSAIGNSIIYDSGSNVGIGTASPNSYTGYTSLTLNNATFGGLIDFNNNGVRVATIYNDASSFILGPTTGFLSLLGGGSERMRINSTGNVSIGNTNNTYNLDVTGTGRFTTAATIGSTETTWNLASSNKLQIQNSLLIGYSNTGTFLTMNLTYNSGWKYISTGAASIFSQDTGDHVFFTSTSGTAGAAATLNEKMRITNAGNVGIGTSSPSGALHIVAGASTTYGILDAPTNGYCLQYYKYNGSTYGYIGQGSALISGASSTDLSFLASNNLLFGTGSTERMRITSGGTGLFGTTTASAGGFIATSFQVGAECVSKGTYAGFFWENRSGGVTSNSNWYGWYTTSGTIYLYNGSANIASINTSSGAYTALSDINKKKDFESSSIGLNAILGLKPTLYRMKTDNEETEKQLGFIAQEVKQFIPQAYVETKAEDKDGGVHIGLNYQAITATLVKAIQEQQKQIEELKSLINK